MNEKLVKITAFKNNILAQILVIEVSLIVRVRKNGQQQWKMRKCQVLFCMSGVYIKLEIYISSSFFELYFFPEENLLYNVVRTIRGVTRGGGYGGCAPPPLTDFEDKLRGAG